MRGFIVVEHRGDGLYHVSDTVGSRVYLRESAAKALADRLNLERCVYVVRSLGYVRTDGAAIVNGQVTLIEPCPCPLPGAAGRELASCRFHGYRLTQHQAEGF